tara:strand:+ start:6130 stop:6387 length:258 start_codon:yes stop_codon:yes gene_type:complete
MKSTGFSCGPFADVLKRVDDFGTSLYFSQLYYETMMQHQELVVQLKLAKNNDDPDLIKELEEQICFIEHACQITDLIDLPFSENN